MRTAPQPPSPSLTDPKPPAHASVPVLATSRRHGSFVATLERRITVRAQQRTGNWNAAPFAVTLYRDGAVVETRYLHERGRADRLLEQLPASAAHYDSLRRQYATC